MLFLMLMLSTPTTAKLPTRSKEEIQALLKNSKSNKQNKNTDGSTKFQKRCLTPETILKARDISLIRMVLPTT